MEIIGNPTISKPLFYLAKSSIIVCAVFPFFKGQVNSFEINQQIQHFAGFAFFVPGIILLSISLINLGKSTRVGIPTDNTKLKTNGLYAISRNPMYLGVFLLCLASCIYVPHWLNLVCCALVIAIHHFIIKNEEKFLAERFKADWHSYKNKVRRYI